MNNQIFKLIKRLFVFLVISFFVYNVLIWLWGSYLPEKYTKNLTYRVGSSYIRFQEIKKYKNIDILFAGSSHAFRGFDPRIFEKAGYSTFNMGSSAQTPFQTKYLLEQYIDTLNPKILIVEVYPFLLTKDGVESSLDIISNNEDVNSLNLVFHHKNFRVLNTFIFSNLYNIFQSKPKDSIIRLSPIDTYVEKGYVQKKTYFNKHRDYKSQKFIYLDLQFSSLEEINKLSKERGILPIYVMAPIDKNLYNCYANLDEFEQRINRLGIYYDFNKLMKLNDTLHFYDSNHLNQDGVELFNAELIEILISLE